MTRHPIQRYVDRRRPDQIAYTTWFSWWGGWISAAHCLDQLDGKPPEFARGSIIHSPGNLDVVLVGCRIPDKRPIEPLRKEPIDVYGFVGGTHQLTQRHANVYTKRTSPGQDGYNGLTWIADVRDYPKEYAEGTEAGPYYCPVAGGMSGGPVMSPAGDPYGVLITQNGMADLDSDGDNDHSFDFVSLADVWDALQYPQPEAGVLHA